MDANTLLGSPALRREASDCGSLEGRESEGSAEGLTELRIYFSLQLLLLSGVENEKKNRFFILDRDWNRYHPYSLPPSWKSRLRFPTGKSFL